MINIPEKSSTAFTKDTILSINSNRVKGSISSSDIMSINVSNTSKENNNIPQNSSIENTITTLAQPRLINTANKGQKVSLETNCRLTAIKACLGWNVKNPMCDVDVSAFLLNNTGKVIGDTWFVFYGQDKSPDLSTIFTVDNKIDRQIISIDLCKINPAVSKIVFVLTINEALENNLNFSMIKDAYIRILNSQTNSEIVSFKMDEYYSNVTSMMIGELYLHNGLWKFNAIGNGVSRDLEGLCELYGVQVI